MSETTNIFIGGNKYIADSSGVITASGTLQKDKILVIRFYYTLKECDYRIEHRILGITDGDNWLFDNEEDSIEEGKAKYGSIVTADASDNNPKSNGNHWHIRLDTGLRAISRMNPV